VATAAFFVSFNVTVFAYDMNMLMNWNNNLFSECNQHV